MSSFYLCDVCKHYDGQSVVAGDYGYCDVGCNGYGSNLKRKKPMHDGIERPTDVCKEYERRDTCLTEDA